MKNRNYKLTVNKGDTRIRQLIFSKDTVGIKLFGNLMDDASVFLYIGENDAPLKNKMKFEDVLELLGLNGSEFKKYRGGWGPGGLSSIKFENIFRDVLKALPKIEENLSVIEGQCGLLK